MSLINDYANHLPILFFLFGGFIISAICGILAFTPWFRGIPYRFWLLLGSLFPLDMLIYGHFFDLFFRGRHFWILVALSPILLIFIPTGVSIYRVVTAGERMKIKLFLSLLIILLIGQIWVSLFFWLATDRGFMGASC